MDKQKPYSAFSHYLCSTNQEMLGNKSGWFVKRNY